MLYVKYNWTRKSGKKEKEKRKQRKDKLQSKKAHVTDKGHCYSCYLCVTNYLIINWYKIAILTLMNLAVKNLEVAMGMACLWSSQSEAMVGKTQSQSD